MDSRKCIACHEVKPDAEFHRNKNGFRGRLNKCRICCRSNYKKYKHYWENIRSSPKRRYYAHVGGAKARGIQWEFTFETWWEMWEPYWGNRGQASDQLQMCRYGDEGPYSPDNCRIDTCANNVREAKAIQMQRKKAEKGHA